MGKDLAIYKADMADIHHNGKDFLCILYKQLNELLQHQCWQGFVNVV